MKNDLFTSYVLFSRTKRRRTIGVSLQETLCAESWKPVQAESEIASAERRVKPLTRLLRCATSLRVTAPLGYGSRRLVWPKGSLPARQARPECPGLGVVRCYQTLSNEIQNHWLICIPPFPLVNSASLQIGPQRSRARSGPLTARTDLESFRSRGKGASLPGAKIGPRPWSVSDSSSSIP